MTNTLRTEHDAMMYVGPWIAATHRDAAHVDRVTRARRLQRCDALGEEVTQAQTTLQRELEKLLKTQKQLAGAAFSDLFFYLKTFPIHLGALPESLTSAETQFDAARARYNQECLGQDAPVYTHQPLAAEKDALRVAVETVATLATKGAIYVVDHPWQAAGLVGVGIGFVLMPELVPFALAF